MTAVIMLHRRHRLLLGIMLHLRRLQNITAQGLVRTVLDRMVRVLMDLDHMVLVLTVLVLTVLVLTVLECTVLVLTVLALVLMVLNHRDLVLMAQEHMVRDSRGLAVTALMDVVHMADADSSFV